VTKDAVRVYWSTLDDMELRGTIASGSVDHTSSTQYIETPPNQWVSSIRWSAVTLDVPPRVICNSSTAVYPAEAMVPNSMSRDTPHHDEPREVMPSSITFFVVHVGVYTHPILWTMYITSPVLAPPTTAIDGRTLLS